MQTSTVPLAAPLTAHPGARAALSIGLLFAWLLSFPLAGPLLLRADPPDLGPLSPAELFALTHAAGLLSTAACTLLRGTAPAARWSGAAAGAAGLALAASPTTAWPPLLAAAGFLSAGAAIAAGCTVAAAPTPHRPWAVAAGAAAANLALYASSRPDLPIPDRALIALLSFGPLALPLTAVPAQNRRGAPPANSAAPDLVRLAPVIFAIYLVGGLSYALLLSELGGLAGRLGPLPYTALLLPAAWAVSRFGPPAAARAATFMVGLGFAAWSISNGAARDAAAQTLAVGGYALLDVPLWTILAGLPGRPAANLGFGLGAMVTGIAGGMLLATPLASAAAGRETETALLACLILLAAAAAFPSRLGDADSAALPAAPDRAGTAAPPRHPDGRARAAALGLSPREADVLLLAARGLSNKEIARELALSTGTVRTLLERAYRKLGARNRAEAATILLAQDAAPAPLDGPAAALPSRPSTRAADGPEPSRETRLEA